MGRERQRKNELKSIAEVNMTPLIDLTFLLLIAFIISFPMIEQGIKIQLPKGNADKLEEKKSTTVTIKYAEGVFFNDRKVTDDDLRAELGKIAKEEPQPPVLVRCDERVDYGELMKTLRLFHECKVTRMALVTEPLK